MRVPGNAGRTHAEVRTARGRHGTALRVAFGLAGVGGVVCALRVTVGLGSDALDTAFSDWVYPLLFLPAAAICFARARVVDAERLAWTAFGVGGVLWSAAWLYYGAYLHHLSSPPYPSLADGLWIAAYPVWYVGLLSLLRSRSPTFRYSIWLDGLIGASALGAVGAAFLVDPIVASSGGRFATVATGLAYPLGDLLLLSVVMTALALTGWRLGRDWFFIALALLIQVCTDTVYVFQVANGDWATGSILDVLWLLPLLLVGWAAWHPPATRTQVSLDRWPVLVGPSLLAVGALGILVYGNFDERLDSSASILASVAVLAALARAGVTFRERREFRFAALRDPLTGLMNHGAFHATLEEEISLRSDTGGRFSVVLLDLDGFKGVNDLRGHAEGDRVLREVAEIVRAGCRSDDEAARVGGDEFAILVRDAEEGAAAAVAERIRRSVIEQRDLGLGLSYGLGEWPGDGPDKAMLLTRADVALYSAKTGAQEASVGAAPSASDVRAGDAEESMRGRRPTATAASARELERAQLKSYAEDVRKSHARELRRTQELQESYLATVKTLAAGVEAKDEYTGGHIQRVHALGLLMARAMVPGEAGDPQLSYGLLLHDIGKLAVPDAVLNKPGKLDEEEWELMRRHPQEGVRILGSIPFLDHGLDVVHHHHERWDGSGYPDGLRHEQIPLWARMFAVVDAVDAITSDRPYRAGRPLQEAIAELRKGAGTQFDPACVEAFATLDRAEVEAQIEHGRKPLTPALSPGPAPVGV